MSGSPGQAAFKLAFNVSPIILTGGVANLIPGAMLPIISITEALSFGLGLLSGGETPSLDDFFASYQQIAGGTLVDNSVAHYPFANQATAANAIITQPLRVSLLMRCPVREPFGYAAKLATMMALQAALAQHNSSGGTYIVATPSYFYTNCLMLGMRDVSSRGKQVQTEWQLDFEQPLLTESAADQAQNALMSKITGGTAFSGAPEWSGLGTVVGQPPSLASSSVVPASIALPAAGASSSNWPTP